MSCRETPQSASVSPLFECDVLGSSPDFYETLSLLAEEEVFPLPPTLLDTDGEMVCAYMSTQCSAVGSLLLFLLQVSNDLASTYKTHCFISHFIM
jgi:hypothetical protein